jgi:hypothetical protein
MVLPTSPQMQDKRLPPPPFNATVERQLDRFAPASHLVMRRIRQRTGKS